MKKAHDTHSLPGDRWRDLHDALPALPEIKPLNDGWIGNWGRVYCTQPV